MRTKYGSFLTQSLGSLTFIIFTPCGFHDMALLWVAIERNLQDEGLSISTWGWLEFSVRHAKRWSWRGAKASRSCCQSQSWGGGLDMAWHVLYSFARYRPGIPCCGMIFRFWEKSNIITYLWFSLFALADLYQFSFDQWQLETKSEAMLYFVGFDSLDYRSLGPSLVCPSHRSMPKRPRSKKPTLQKRESSCWKHWRFRKRCMKLCTLSTN